jgi:hypothetical protein
MSKEDIIMTIDKPHFIVRVHTTQLEVDLKEGARKELEKLLEANPGFRDSVGLLFQTIVPLDVRLRDIRSVALDKKGRVKIDVPRRKDLTIPLNKRESKRLIDKLNKLIPLEKERALRDAEAAKEAENTLRAKRAAGEKEVTRGRVEA